MYTEVSAGFRGIWSRPEGFETTSKAEIEAAQRVLDRLNAADCPKPQPDLKNRINDVVNKIDQIADRITAIEKLSLIHDNYLREDAQKANCPKGTDTTPKR
jgi:hypothetical protein